MSMGTPASDSLRPVSFESPSSTIHWPSVVLTQLWTACYHILAISAIFMLIMDWLQSKDTSLMVMVSIGFLFSDAPLLSNLVAFLLGVSLFVRILGRVFDSGLGICLGRNSHLVQETLKLQDYIPAENQSVEGAQSNITGHDTATDTAKVAGSVETEEALLDFTAATLAMSTDGIDCELTTAEGITKKTISNYSPASTRPDSSSESIKSGSTHTEMDIHTSNADSDADSGEEEDGDDMSINSEYVLDMILKKWDEDPSYDFGHFTDRNVYNALFNGNLDATRMRRLKIGFQRLLASLDNRFADFDGLTLSSE
ncbi:MAG: hypothetical protein Q9173_005221 [Seirophora scorigena]